MNPSNSNDPAALLEQKKRELQQKLAAMMKGGNIAARPPGPPPQISNRPTQPNSTYQPPGFRPQIRPPSSTRSASDLQKRILETQNRIQTASTMSKNATAATQAPKITGGLNSQLHPLLAAVSGKSDGNQNLFIPKPNFATTKINQKVTAKPIKKEVKEEKEPDPTENPYFDPSLGTDTLGPKLRAPRSLRFNTKGKFIAQGNQMRAEIKAEQLKEQILNTAKRSGLEGKLDLITSDQTLNRAPPPEVEWWDSPFLPSQAYSDVDANRVNLTDQAGLTNYIHHPVAIKSASTTAALPAKPMMLTKKEQKKLRRQRRQHDLNEKREKIRLGLLPPEEPKVKLSNLMRVLANESVQDPTKIEAKVRRDVALRKLAHEQQNQDRKLTPDQRREKTERKLAEELKYYGHYCNVYKVGDLTHPQFKFKVDKNAQQLHLTGVVILAEPFCLVVVEGSPKSIKAYKKLMLRRIKWSDQAEVNGKDDDDMSVDDEDESQSGDIGAKGNNYCHLVWEGQIANPIFKGFRFKKCPTDGIAKEFLGKGKGDHFWDLAKAFEA